MESQLTQKPSNPAEVPVREKQASRETTTYEGTYFEPAVDIYETDDALFLLAEVPGVTADAVETELRDNVLTLTARVPEVPASFKPVYGEYRVGHYFRQFRLGQHIDQARIDAQLKDGVLKLTLPKVDAAKPRKIAVRT